MDTLLTLDEVLKHKPQNQVFLVVLKNDLVVEVSQTKARCLKIGLDLTDLTITNSQQKQAVQQAHQDNSEQAEFVAQLDHPGIHMYKNAVPWRWGSAGYAVRLIVNGEPYWVFQLRSGVKPAGWNLLLGATTTMDELLRPQDAAERKGKRELIVIDLSTRKYQRLEVCGGKYMPMRLHRQMLRTLGVVADMNDQPLIGTVAGDLPDMVHVQALWAKDRGPFVSARGLVIMNPEDGEIGLEFIQVVEWKFDKPVSDLRLFDGESFESGAEASGHVSGQPLNQPIGLFRESDIIREIQKDNPQLTPCVVYENGFAHVGAELERWLEAHPDSRKLCPVTGKTLKRYLLDVRGLGNSIVRTATGWRVTFDGHSTEYKQSCGFKTFVYLVENKDKQFEFDEIDARFRPPSTPRAGQSAGAVIEMAAEGVHLMEGFAQEEFDAKKLTARLIKLGRDIMDLKKEKAAAQNIGHGNSVEEIQADIDRFMAEADGIRDLLAAIKQSKSQTVKSDSSRLRQRIRRSLQRVLHDFRGSDRHLYAHFRDYLNYGRHCIYEPPKDVTWRIQLKPDAR